MATPTPPAKPTLDELIKKAMEVAKKARSSGASLSGDNFYANKLVELRIQALNQFKEMPERSAGEVATIAEMIQTTFTPDTPWKERVSISRELFVLLQTVWKDEKPKKVEQAVGLFPLSILNQTKRGYLVLIGREINGCYDGALFDGCAVMMRRLLEVVIIEAYEGCGIDAKIKNANGDFDQLTELITKALGESTWNLSRNTKKHLPRLKDLGHQSAHGKYFHAKPEDIQKLEDGFRVVIEEFLHIAKLL